MKLILISFVFLLTSLTLIANINAALKKEEPDDVLINVLKIILNDLEFLALNPRKQLRVITMVYYILKSPYRSRFGMKKRDEAHQYHINRSKIRK